MSSDCSVVITGMGIVSPLGLLRQTLWDSLIQKKSGVSTREEFQSYSFPCRIASQILDFDPRKYVRPRKSLKVMCRPIQFGFAASTLAVADAGLEGNIDPDRFSTVFGTEAFYADPNEVARVFRQCIVNRCYDHDRWGQHSMREIEPLWMLKYLPNMVASHISIACDARGPSNTICQSEASSLLAIIEAIDLIKRGYVDAVIAGGTGSLMATTGLIYRGMQRLSGRVDAPEAASRPFDESRDGMVVGEGATAFVLEREDFAKARGAKPLAKILGHCRGWAPFDDGFSDAISSSLQTSLDRGGLSANDVGHVNANGVSVVQEDIYEAQAIQKVLGDTPVIAPKSNFGNIGPGTGALELASSIEACHHGLLPPVLNLDKRDSRCPINIVAGDAQSTNNKVGMTCNFTEMGQIVSLLFSA